MAAPEDRGIIETPLSKGRQVAHEKDKAHTTAVRSVMFYTDGKTPGSIAIELVSPTLIGIALWSTKFGKYTDRVTCPRAAKPPQAGS